MSELPVRTTKTDALLRAIEGLGNDKNGRAIGIRTTALAEATGVPANSIQALLTPHVASGRLCVCKVSTPSGQSQNEYRKGAGVPTPTHTPLSTRRAGIASATPTRRPADAHMAKGLLPAAPAAPAVPEVPVFLTAPQPAVGQNTGSQRMEPSSLKTPSGAPADTARTVEPTPPAVRERRGMGPAPVLPVAGAALRLAINQAGELQLGDEEDPARYVFTPQQTKQLGYFLRQTHDVWNPF